MPAVLVQLGCCLAMAEGLAEGMLVYKNNLLKPYIVQNS
jgi:hypothetical protein